MKRSIGAGLLLVLLNMTSWACGGNDNSTTTSLPTQPSQAVTETFSGTLNQNGAATFPFVAQAAGSVIATLSSIEPDNTIAIGMSLGTWNGSACTVAIANDNATQGAIVAGNISSAGNVCVRVYDVGNIVDPVTYAVQVVHP